VRLKEFAARSASARGRWEVCPGRASALLSLVEILHSRAFDRADMHEDILIGFDKSEAFLEIQKIVFRLGGPSAPSMPRRP
jgi:hypothetical protein